jgi:CDP-glucose 4,6-dehydratase
MNNLKNKNIFVTGATGLVGSHLVEKLLDMSPNKIICLIRSHDPKSYFYSNGFDKKVVSVFGDLNDKERIFNIITKYEINDIFHIAAQAIVPTAYINPYEVLTTNILGTINILEAARLTPNIQSIVVASTDKAYGKDCIDATEDQALTGDHPYDVSKSCTDLIALAYHNTYNMPITVSRFGNIYGPGDLNFNRIIPGIFKSAILNQELQIRSDGKFIRDYVYVKDVVDGYIALAEKINISKGQAFNFSTGYNFSVLNLIDKIKKIIDKKINFKIINNQKNEIPEQSLNYKKAEKLLEWKAKYTFENSIQETFKWYKNYFKLI